MIWCRLQVYLVTGSKGRARGGISEFRALVASLPAIEEAPPATMVDVRIGKEIAEQSITQAHYHTQDEHGREDPTLLKKFFFIILDCTIPLQDNTNLDMRTSIPTEQRAKTLMVLWWVPTITLMKLVCPKLSNMLPTKKDFKLPAPPFPYTIWNIRFRSKIRPKLSQLVKLI